MPEDSIALQRFKNRARWIAVACTIASGAVALFGCLTWLSGHWQLSTLGPGNTPIAPGTAVSMLLLSGAIAVPLCWPSTRAAQLFGKLVAAAVAVGCLVPWVAGAFGAQVRLRNWLPIPHDTLGGVPVGEMSPFTALAFVLASASALLLFAPASRSRRFS